MNEAETRAEHIDPALKAAGWGVIAGSRIRREFFITPGRIEGHGKRGKALKADYVLEYRNHRLAVVEAKAWDEELTEGVGQAKDYAGKLSIRFAYSSNGRGVYAVDMRDGNEGEVPTFPSPDELWDRTFEQQNNWRDRFAVVPYPDKGGSWDIRYYQQIAVERVLERIATGSQRMLLTLATGTGKTSIAFQIAWKLFEARWNLTGEPTRRPRILFLADRNGLANQAFNDFNSFAAFEDKALVRIDPEIIRKHGGVPKNGSIFFTIFQTFMSGTDSDGNPAPNFGDYPPDFFDIVIIDECHRGGANDESTWREILTYFKPAVQLGLTATPKRKANADTYKYFGEPIYTYSLREGINDGFLTPFKVKQIATTMDDYTYTPDDAIVEGEVVPGKRYVESDFNKVIIIPERETYRVKLFLDQIDQREKTLVFCATQAHALMVRDLINQMKKSKDPNYCVRVTAEDGALADQHLRDFQDNDKTIPPFSRPRRSFRLASMRETFVLMRPVNSMIEFKQIIGRGTRLYEGKDYFTIYDFVKAYQHFNDPEWDGEPVEPEQPQPRPPKGGGDEEPKPREEDDEEPKPQQRLKIKLADGKERTIQHMMATTFWSADGKPMSAAQFIERLFGELPALFKNEDELRALWGEPGTRKALLEGLAEKGFSDAQLAELKRLIDAEKSDLYDVLAYIAFALAPITREERVQTRKGAIFDHYGDDKLRGFLEFVLAEYVKEGVGELDQSELTPLLELKYHAVSDAARELGGIPKIRETFIGFQKYLYSDVTR